MLQRLLSWRIKLFCLCQPIVFHTRSIHICRYIVIIIGCKHHIQSLNNQVALTIFHRWHQRIAPTMLISIHHILTHTCLNIFIHIRKCEAKHQSIYPRFSNQPNFCHHSFVMISIIEALHPLFLGFIYPPCLEILYCGINPIVVV